MILTLATYSGRAVESEEAHYNAAVNLYNAGQWEAALKKIAEREAQSLPDAMRAKYLYMRGLTLEKSGRPADARRTYAALVEKYAARPEAGRAQVALLYLDYAARDYEGVLARQGKLDPALLNADERRQVALMTAESFYAKKEWKPALASYQAALSQGADKTAVAPKLFEVYYQLRQYPELVQLSAGGIAGMKSELLALVRAEALLALHRPKEAEAEAAKVAKTDGQYPRAALILAQALIQQGRLKEGVAPLQDALKGMQDPPAPPAAYLTLAECLLAAGDLPAAEKAVATAVDEAPRLAESERPKHLEQARLLTVRIALESKDERKIAAAVDQARPNVPGDKLAEILYLRLYALHQVHDGSGIVRSFTDDYPVLRASSQDGPATLIYAAALKEAGREKEARQLLEDLIKRKPSSGEALEARRELAYAALKQDDFTGARDALKSLLAERAAPQRFTGEVLAELRYNYALAALKTGEREPALSALKLLQASKPAPELARRAWILLGQAYAETNDYRNAAAQWQKALDLSPSPGEEDLRDRLGRAYAAAKDHARAQEQFTRLADKLGGPEKLARESRETWARALYAAQDFAGAAKLYAGLQSDFRDTPAYAYECAVCHEKLGQWPEAEKGYAASAEKRERLPPEYAADLDQRLAQARLKSGAGDQGLPYWLEQLTPAKPDRDFSAATVTLLQIVRKGSQLADIRAGLESALRAYGPATNRYYALGALLLESLAAGDDTRRSRDLANQLATEFSAHEKDLSGQDWGVTVAPAMINFYRGEAERQAGNIAAALAAYETVLAAYPYNEWPDAAAFGAAECYAASGDFNAASNKWSEIIKAGAGAPGALKWQALARKRLAETSSTNAAEKSKGGTSP